MYRKKTVSLSLEQLVSKISEDQEISKVVTKESESHANCAKKEIQISRLIDLLKCNHQAISTSEEIAATADSCEDTCEQNGAGYLTEINNFLNHSADILELIPGLAYAAAILVPQEVDFPVAQIICRDPAAAFSSLVPLFFEEIHPARHIHPSSSVHTSVVFTDKSTCSIGANVSIGEGCQIGDGVTIHPNVSIAPGVVIGDNTCIHSNVSIEAGVRIGSQVIVQSGAVIGSIGFGYRPDKQGELQLIPHLGSVIIEDKVHIGANTCIDRGVINDTVIGYGTKLDNLVQIGHNNLIGKHVIMCGQVGVAGSCTIGDRVTLGGKAGVADHKSITTGVRIGGYSGVTKDITSSGDYAGFPARPYREWLKQLARR